MYVIYVHTNMKNGKPYIGYAEVYDGCVTPHDAMMKRWEKGHLKDVRHGSTCYFHNAIRKWGASDDTWRHEVLDVVMTLESAKHVETCWIAQRRTFAYDRDGRGYNTTRGGEGSVGHVYKHDAERKLKISIALTGRVVKQETREKQRQNMTGKRWKQAKKRVSRAGVPQTTSRRVEQLDQFTNASIVTYTSIQNAARAMGTKASASNIIRSCTEPTRNAYGFKWRYA